MDDDTNALLLQRRQLAQKMLEVDPGSDEMKALLDQEAAIVQQIKGTGTDLGDPTVAYGIAYGVLAPDPTP